MVGVKAEAEGCYCTLHAMFSRWSLSKSIESSDWLTDWLSDWQSKCGGKGKQTDRWTDEKVQTLHLVGEVGAKKEQSERKSNPQLLAVADQCFLPLALTLMQLKFRRLNQEKRKNIWSIGSKRLGMSRDWQTRKTQCVCVSQAANDWIR